MNPECHAAKALNNNSDVGPNVFVALAGETDEDLYNRVVALIVKQTRHKKEKIKQKQSFFAVLALME